MTSLLLNPKKHNRYYPDQHTRDLMLKTIQFFETKGKRKLKADDHDRIWYTDFLDFQKQEKIFSDSVDPQHVWWSRMPLGYLA